MAGEDEEDEILQLFDLYWFESLILTPQQTAFKDEVRHDHMGLSFLISPTSAGFSRSVAELEFEEIKGFTDLGFEFSEEDKRSPRLASILPGLRRLGEEVGAPERAVSRPYLSEAWGEEETSVLVVMMRNEADMKSLLRMWARSVASAVRWHRTGSVGYIEAIKPRA